MSTKTEISVPEGYMKDAQGRLIPKDTISQIDIERDDFVIKTIVKALALSGKMSKFKRQTMNDLDKFIKHSAKKYKAKVGGAKGNVTIYSFDGEFKLVRNINDTISFDERLQVAKDLIDECIQEWSQDSNDNLKIIINDAFSVDKQGKLNKSRILGLRRLSVKDAKWNRAMKAISDSVQVVSSKPYVRFYQRDEEGNYKPISLDVATL